MEHSSITPEIKDLLYPLLTLHDVAKDDESMDDFYYRAYIGDEIDRITKILTGNYEDTKKDSN